MSDEFVTIDLTNCKIGAHTTNGVNIDGVWYPYSEIEYFDIEGVGFIEADDFYEMLKEDVGKVLVKKVSVPQWLADKEELSYD